MAPSGDHGRLDLSFDPKEREGLTTEQVEELYTQWGYNELPVVQINLYWLFFVQFTGTMPYILELCCIITLVTKPPDFEDLGIILALVKFVGILKSDPQFFTLFVVF